MLVDDLLILVASATVAFAFPDNRPFSGATTKEACPPIDGVGPEVKSGLKRCPDCAEEVQAAARVCRHCGYDFETGRQRSAVGSRASGYAIASLILGLLWVAGVGTILGVVFGRIAKREIRESNATVGGSGMATAGLILGYLGIVALIGWGFLLAGG